MAIGGIGGNQPVDNNKQQKTSGLNFEQAKTQLNSIFGADASKVDSEGMIDKADVNGDKKLDKAEVNNLFASMKAALANIMGGNKAETAQEPTGTPEDVKAATIENRSVDNSYKFDNNGNVQSDVNNNSDGSKTIKAGDETLQVSPDGNSFSVKSENGNFAVAKTPDGGFEYTDEKGEKHKFDKEMNPQ